LLLCLFCCLLDFWIHSATHLSMIKQCWQHAVINRHPLPLFSIGNPSPFFQSAEYAVPPLTAPCTSFLPSVQFKMHCPAESSYSSTTPPVSYPTVYPSGQRNTNYHHTGNMDWQWSKAGAGYVRLFGGLSPSPCRG
jgi:hypothetical protein